MKEHRLKNALIKAGFKAFASEDYKKVSTNDIVKEAGVSKGLLFHYFKNKENFYMNLYEMAWNIIYREVFADFPFENTDLFERLKLFLMRKTETLLNHKTLASFIKSVHMNTIPTITKRRAKIYLGINQKHYKRLFDSHDESKLAHPEYFEELFKTVAWTFSRIVNEWEKAYHKMNNEEALRILEKEMTHYVDFFKLNFYK